jgi:hypothetical protein
MEGLHRRGNGVKGALQRQWKPQAGAHTNGGNLGLDGMKGVKCKIASATVSFKRPLTTYPISVTPPASPISPSSPSTAARGPSSHLRIKFRRSICCLLLSAGGCCYRARICNCIFALFLSRSRDGGWQGKPSFASRYDRPSKDQSPRSYQKVSHSQRGTTTEPAMMGIWALRQRPQCLGLPRGVGFAYQPHLLCNR